MTRPHPFGPCAATLLALVSLIPAASPTDAAERNARPSIVSRTAWGAKAAETSRMKPLDPREIIIHHTAEKRRPALPLPEKLQKLQRFSQAAGLVGTTPKPPWGDVPYHFYIDAHGTIGEGRSLAFAGDSNTPYDTAHGIQIVVEGNFDEEEPGAAQLAALDRLVRWLAARYGIPAARISGHSDHVGNTACPGRGLKAHLPALRAKVAKASGPSPPPR